MWAVVSEYEILIRFSIRQTVTSIDDLRDFVIKISLSHAQWEIIKTMWYLIHSAGYRF